MRMKLGEMLVQANVVTPQQVQEALNRQKANGGRLGGALVALGYVKDEQIIDLLSRRFGVPKIKLDDFAVDPAVAQIVPGETAWKYQVLPVSRSGATLTLAMADPTNKRAMEEIKLLTGYNVEPVLASETALESALDRCYGSSYRPQVGGGANGGSPGNSVKEVLDAPSLTMEDLASVGLSEVDLDAMADADAEVGRVTEPEEDEVDLGNLSKSAEAAPVVKLTNVLLVDALKHGASDIHVEPYEKEFRVRFRIDGILYNAMALPMKLREPLTSRLKTMARLDVTERRLPQEGRIKIKMKIEDRGRDLDFRVFCLPTRWGEKIVLRLLDKSKLMLDMTKLGFEAHSLDRFKRAIAKPYGIVLVTGPTGSGKTNTLYSAIASLNKPDTNIMTAEDPVEFNLPGINQVQIRDNIGLNFAAALRSFLRQDPNIILVGEIRDYETAEIAVKASLTGHLVLSTLHTNDAPSTVSRLVNMGIEPFLVGTAVNLIQAQRLIRKVCANCKVEITDMPTKTLIEIGVPPDQVKDIKLYKGKGCGTCNGTGYKGRVGLYEVMEISEGIRDLVMVGATAVEIKRKAREEGMLTLRESGLEKIKAGITTIEEVLRETVL